MEGRGKGVRGEGGEREGKGMEGKREAQVGCEGEGGRGKGVSEREGSE